MSHNPLNLASYETEQDLRRLLIDPQVEEGVYFEFKREYSGSVRRKLGKHVSAFANSYGGLLAIGLEADGLAAANLPGIEEDPREIQDSVSRKICSTVNPIPLFSTRLVQVAGSNRFVLLIKVEESAFPPHLFDGMIYLRPAASSDPVKPADKSEIDRLYEKAARTNKQLELALAETWLETLNIPNATSHLIACPMTAKRELISDFDEEFFRFFEGMSRNLPNRCRNKAVISNEIRCYSNGFATSRVTRYGLIESISQASRDEKQVTVLSLERLEIDINDFLKACRELFNHVGYTGSFLFLAGARRIRDRKMSFRWMNQAAPTETSTVPSQRTGFEIRRKASFGGEEGLADDSVRKAFLESVVKEFVCNFGGEERDSLESIQEMIFLKPEELRWD